MRERYPGQHEARRRIVGESPKSVARACGPASRGPEAPPSPLAGKLFDENGEPLYVQGAAKGGRRYRYYVSRELVRGASTQTRVGWRVPAPEFERAVSGAARSVLDDRHVLLAEVQESGIELLDVNLPFEITSACSTRFLAETESAAALVELIERVQLTAEGIRLVLRIPIPSGQISDQATSKLPRLSFCAAEMDSRATLPLG